MQDNCSRVLPHQKLFSVRRDIAYIYIYIKIPGFDPWKQSLHQKLSIRLHPIICLVKAPYHLFGTLFNILKFQDSILILWILS